MMTSSNGNISALLAICAGNSPASAQRPVTRSIDVFFDLCLNKRLRKPSWSWWFETLSRPLWRHCNGITRLINQKLKIMMPFTKSRRWFLELAFTCFFLFVRHFTLWCFNEWNQLTAGYTQCPYICVIYEYAKNTNHGDATMAWGLVGLWGFLWWAASAKRKDYHGVSSEWSSVWHRSNTGLSSTQYEQIPITLGVWLFWLTPLFLRSITFWRAYG